MGCPAQRGDELARLGEHLPETGRGGRAIQVAAVDRVPDRAGERGQQLGLPPQRHQPVAGHEDHRHGNVQLADPLPRAEAAQRFGRLQHRPAVVPRQQPTGGRHHAERTEAQPIGRCPPEVTGGGTQDKTLDPVPVAVRRELGDRSAHRVADRDEAVDPEHVRQGHRVVGAVGEPETPGPDPPAVTPVVERHDPERLRERHEGGRPIRTGRRAQAVEQHHRRGARRACGFEHPGRPATRQLHGSSAGKCGFHGT